MKLINNMLWLNRSAKTLVGIDIGTRYIKLLELEHNEQQAKVLQYAIAELPITVLTESNEIKNTTTISSTLSQLKQSAKISSSNAAIAMPGSAIITKQIIIEAGLSSEAMEAQAWLEASKHFPELVEDLSLDFYEYGPSSQEENKLDVLLVACRKTSVQKLVDLMRDSGFQADIVDVDYYALERILQHIVVSLPELDQTQTHAILNFGTLSSTLVVIRNGRLLYAHDQIFDGQRIINKLSQELQWPDLLLNPAAIPKDIDVNAISSVIEPIANHVNYTLELLYSSVSDVNISKLFLAGDCAIIPKIAESVTTLTNIDTAIANPLVNMSLAENLDTTNLQILAPALALCSGLALHEGKE